jgi:ATP-dependent DNA helicase RecG
MAAVPAIPRRGDVPSATDDRAGNRAAGRPAGARRQPPLAFASTRALSRSELAAAAVRTPCPSRLSGPPGRVGRAAAEALAALGIDSVGALLEHVPRDRLAMQPLRGLRTGERATVAVEVAEIASRPLPRGRGRGARSVVTARVFDASGSRRAMFFNQPWLARSYPPGTRLLLHGKLAPGGRLQVWSHAREGGDHAHDAEPHGPAQEGGRRFPLYPASAEVPSTRIAALVRAARPALAHVADPLPPRLRAAERLAGRAAALSALHFAATDDLAERARLRLAFEELLLAQLELLARRARRRARPAPLLAGAGGGALSARWLERGLPFEPTGDQRAAMRAIDADLRRGCPMQRLLIGEVGSGKTVVALYAMLRAAEHGHQAVLMAPTETLAEQHEATLRTLLARLDPAGPEDARGASAGEALPAVRLLSGSTPRAERRRLLERLRSGERALVVGTHALIEQDVGFRSLALAVVDEQHRFGVRQRAALDRKGPRPAVPHVLHMSATPIPRTLALATYGDLDVSTLRELPPGRRPVETRVVAGEAGRARAYEALRAHLAAGRQGYVVCPLVERPEEEAGALAQDGAADGTAGGGREALGGEEAPADARREPVEGSPSAGEQDRRAATAELERLSAGALRGFRLRLLHGRMQPAEKQAAMAAFNAGEADVLVCTTVVEVGIDVPNATAIVIENAERFGIAQLHQLRGRVGRGEHAGECFLVGADTRSRRLRALARHADGFALAEIDLALRGRGELTGTRQSGAERLRFARLPEDGDLLRRARAWAGAILAADRALRAPEHFLLREAFGALAGAGTLEPIPG